MKKILAIAILLITTQNLISQTAKELNTKGIELAKKGKIDKAFSIFEKAIKLYPDSPGPYTNRGNVYRMRKEYELAIKDYTKSLKLDPENLNVLYAKANTYLDAGNFEMAISDYSEIIDIKPSFSDIYFQRAYAKIRLEKYEEAKIDLESQLKISSKDFKSLTNLINIKKELKLFEEALADYEKIVSEFPNQPNLHILYNNWASLYKEIKKPEEALVKINLALKLKKNYDIGHFNRAGIYLKLNDQKKACKDFKKAIKLNLEKNEHFEVDEEYEQLKKLCE
ncbi:tetratricopeptide repeat protein [Psychroserpens ponticola]|uniref:Tetratricopeptide repeat protein n=1 Tax=Psychroserpens ponticola TaxID=2932268 RepID=A0ABY7RT57_9FLAO|nr:tetratricopeptide repeat protein [Psychroserpens ponticola]WCO00294.1 tetratricopeptide repeat protein [Psychroserpens ponticola]